MAPLTRLQLQPGRRVRYSGASNAARVRNTTRTAQTATATGRIAKKGAPSKAAEPKTKPKTMQCAFCAMDKTDKEYLSVESSETCQHFRVVCRSCIELLVKGQVTDRRLHKASLPCVYPHCQFVLDFVQVKEIVSRGVFDSWDNALVKHHVTNGPNFIACLNTACGEYFSIEDWKEECKRRKKIACPYCESDQCIMCSRPWSTGHTCEKTREQEEQENAKALKKIGAKACPSCGVQIKKAGGCDHMTCKKCMGQFCWNCLATQGHNEGCLHRQPPPPPPGPAAPMMPWPQIGMRNGNQAPGPILPIGRPPRNARRNT